MTLSCAGLSWWDVDCPILRYSRTVTGFQLKICQRHLESGYVDLRSVPTPTFFFSCLTMPSLVGSKNKLYRNRSSLTWCHVQAVSSLCLINIIQKRPPNFFFSSSLESSSCSFFIPTSPALFMTNMRGRKKNPTNTRNHKGKIPNDSSVKQGL